VWITILLSVGKEPLPMFTDKTQEKVLVEGMKEKYGTHRVPHGLDVASINNDSVIFVRKVIYCKLLKKLCRDKV
jgi:hypothetical protein